MLINNGFYAIPGYSNYLETSLTNIASETPIDCIERILQFTQYNLLLPMLHTMLFSRGKYYLILQM